MAEKDFKSLDEQLAILKSRGLKIADTDKAKHFLYRNNYYRISGYARLSTRVLGGTLHISPKLSPSNVLFFQLESKSIENTVIHLNSGVFMGDCSLSIVLPRFSFRPFTGR